ncbi:FAD-dependent thymidylate synthase [Clostridium sp.]|uniref:FAD-dependent thymidylate synthase n=1 Tax=Clostridium sp. TaxID=1506 RepID=UPI0032176C58
MKVKLINPNEVQNLFNNWGEFACTCYNTSKEYAEKVGRSCAKSEHMSGSRCEYIKFEIEGDRGTLEQIMRHEIGVRYDEIDKYAYQDRIELILDINPNTITKNMQSFRYVDKPGFSYVIPNSIKECEEALLIYNNTMKTIDNNRIKIKEILVSKGISKEKAIESANFLLPRATELTLTIGFTPEALIHFMHKRLCSRAQDEIREIAQEMKKRVAEVSEQFSKELVPHCDYLLWCPEGSKCCGRKESKEMTKKILQVGKNYNNQFNWISE